MVTGPRARGLPAFGEPRPQYLFLSYDNYEEPGSEGEKSVMSPPLRPKDTQERLWRGLAFNDLQAISTDHCPFCMKEQKVIGKGDFSKIPNGAPGIETRMSLVYDGGVRTGRISLNRFVELTSTSPAKIFGLFPRKGTIAPGSDADIVVFDPNRAVTLAAKTLHMNVDYSPYEGRRGTGAPDTVLSRGRLARGDGRFVGRPGGVRTSVDMPLNSVPATTTVAALEAKREASRGQCHVDVGFWGGVVPGNAPHLDGLVDAGVRGFKCFLVPSGVDEFPAVDERDLRDAMPILARRDVPLLVHAEDPALLRDAGSRLPGRSSAGADRSKAGGFQPSVYANYLTTRPPEAEVEAIGLIFRLSREVRARVHILHVASAEAAGGGHPVQGG